MLLVTQLSVAAVPSCTALGPVMEILLSELDAVTDAVETARTEPGIVVPSGEGKKERGNC